jgi:hypothetical protein
LLNFDHSDPLGVLLMIDAYAIRSREYVFLLDLCFSEQFEENLSVLPNFAYNTALVKFLYESEPQKIERKGLSSTKSLLSATELLRSAIMLFPTVIPSLLTKLGVSQLIVTDKGVRHNLFEHNLFLITPNLPDLQPLITLYISRNYSLWKLPNVTEWLTETLKLTFVDILNNDPMLENYRAMISEAYNTKTDKFLKHYLLSEIGEVLDLLPSHLTRNGLEIYDALEIPADQANVNPLSLFFRTLLPWGDPLMRQRAPPAWFTSLLNQLGLEWQQPHQ